MIPFLLSLLKFRNQNVLDLFQTFCEVAGVVEKLVVAMLRNLLQHLLLLGQVYVVFLGFELGG